MRRPAARWRQYRHWTRWRHRGPGGSPIRFCGPGCSGMPGVLIAAWILMSGSRSARSRPRPASRRPRRSLFAGPARYAASAWHCRCGTGISPGRESGVAWSPPTAPGSAADGPPIARQATGETNTGRVWKTRPSVPNGRGYYHPANPERPGGKQARQMMREMAMMCTPVPLEPWMSRAVRATRRFSARVSGGRAPWRAANDDLPDRLRRQRRLRHEPGGGAFADEILEVSLRMR